MKIKFAVLTCLIMTACESSQISEPTTFELPKTSTFPLTEKEALNFACDRKDGTDKAACICIQTQMLKLGQRKSFEDYIVNEDKCGTSDNPRQKAITYIKIDAAAICHGFPSCPHHGWAAAVDGGGCPIYMTCWDGSVPDPRNPCEQECPQIPR